jgi:predicted DNA-binding protein
VRAKPITKTLTQKSLERLEELCRKSGLTKSDLIKMLILAQSDEIERILKVGGEGEVSKSN